MRLLLYISKHCELRSGFLHTSCAAFLWQLSFFSFFGLFFLWKFNTFYEWRVGVFFQWGFATKSWMNPRCRKSLRNWPSPLLMLPALEYIRGIWDIFKEKRMKTKVKLDLSYLNMRKKSSVNEGWSHLPKFCNFNIGFNNFISLLNTIDCQTW